MAHLYLIVRLYLAVCTLFFLSQCPFSAPAHAQEATPTPTTELSSPSPTPTPTGSPTGSPTPAVSPTPYQAPPDSELGLWGFLDSLLVGLENAIFSIWPSTPEILMLGKTMELFTSKYPAVPWFLLGEIINALFVVFMFAAIKNNFKQILDFLMFIASATKIGWLVRLIGGL